MAWNPSPKVADCRDIARKWGGKHQVIILAVDRTAGTLQLATYGETKTLCADAKRLGEMAYQMIFDAYDPDVPMIDCGDADLEHAGCPTCGHPANDRALRSPDRPRAGDKQEPVVGLRSEPEK